MCYKIMQYLIIAFFLAIINADCLSQETAMERQPKRLRLKNRLFQFSIFPGVSTNGNGSGFYINQYSFNLFGGFSAGNKILELGLITNSTIGSVSGIQVAGFANIVGANAFLNLTLSEEHSLINSGFESNSRGVQIAGLLNYVRNNTSAFQLSGGLNMVNSNFEGIQVAAIGNSAGGTAGGIQLAGLYNLAHESVGGFQISTLFNYTDMQLSGIQIALINKARYIKGKKTIPSQSTRGLQIGLINHSREMDGTQIGLLNFGGRARGKQIGLINFFKTQPLKDYGRMGMPIGLLNFGSSGSYMRIYYSELFPMNLEYTTGNNYNGSLTQSGMPFFDRNLKHNQNVLILNYNNTNDAWGFGYGFQRMLYNKVAMMPRRPPAPQNGTRVMNYGIKFIHLNRELKLDRTFNLVSKVNFDYGIKFRWMYFFCGLSVNYFLHEDKHPVYEISRITTRSFKVFGINSEIWPGYAVGVQIL
jgi:hypothetical protein